MGRIVRHRDELATQYYYALNPFRFASIFQGVESEGRSRGRLRSILFCCGMPRGGIRGRNCTWQGGT